jgi:hypothetical protein
VVPDQRFGDENMENKHITIKSQKSKALCPNTQGRNNDDVVET